LGSALLLEYVVYVTKLNTTSRKARDIARIYLICSREMVEVEAKIAAAEQNIGALEFGTIF